VFLKNDVFLGNTPEKFGVKEKIFTFAVLGAQNQGGTAEKKIFFGS